MTTKAIPPLLKYPGAKWRLAEWIIGNMPPHESYVEPYFGSGAVFFRKIPVRIEIINDMDGDVVNFFKVIRERPEELARAIALTPWARQEFEAEREPATGELERARRFAVRCWMAFGASVESKTWRHTTGKGESGGPDNPKLWSRVPESVLQSAKRLKQTQIENRPAIEVIARLNGPQVLIYADPPYLISTRTAHREQYHHEMTDTDHGELLAALMRHRGMVLLSGYDCPLYRERLARWHVESIKTTAERGVRRTECLWINPVAEARLSRQLRLGSG